MDEIETGLKIVAKDINQRVTKTLNLLKNINLIIEPNEFVALVGMSGSEKTTFLNFLASHDGIGIRPVEGILSQRETDALIERVTAHGGYVSYKTNPDGSKSAYELNISYFDALSDPNESEPLSLQAQRFLASQAIMLCLQGVPGIYVHSLFGSRNYSNGVEKTGYYRSINREKFQRDALENELQNAKSTINLEYFSIGYDEIFLEVSGDGDGTVSARKGETSPPDRAHPGGGG